MTIKDIARLAGVSISTVSKIMNQKDSSISNATREKVLNIIKEYNYAPYAMAAPSRHSKTFLLGVLLRSSKSSFLSGLTKQAQAQGYSILVYETADDLDLELKGLTTLLKHNVDGLLWEPICQESLQWETHITEAHIPFLVFDAPFAESAFNFDTNKASYFATETLIKNKHANIACLLSEGNLSDAFFDGYKQCLLDYNLPFNKNSVYSSVQTSLLQKIVSHQISAIVSFSPDLAYKLYEMLQSLHISVPRDFSLITLQDDSLQNGVYPRLSAITLSYFQYASELCQALIDCIEKHTNPSGNIFELFNPPNNDTISFPYSFNPQKFLVVGSINIDSYMFVNELPQTGKATITSSFYTSPGGKGINQAIGVAKLGSPVSLIGSIGNDIESETILSTLSNYSIDHNGITRTETSVTGKAYIFLDHSGDSIILILAGANQALTASMIEAQEELFKNTSYCLIQTEIPMPAVLTSAKLAKKHQAKTILKPSACTHLSDELLSHIDILVPNQSELEVLCPKHSDLETKAEYFLKKGVDTVIVTLGAAGCFLKTKNDSMYFDAFDFQPIDNTGAADAFISALAVYLQKDYPMQKAIQIASYAAGFSISREGIVPSLIDSNTLESYVKQMP